MIQSFRESEKILSVRAEVDVVVAGGGLGGIAAAMAAARSGVRTLLVERNSYPGGVATAGMCCSIFNCFYTRQKVLGTHGIAVEIADALAEAAGYGVKWHQHKGHIIYDIEQAKHILTEKLISSGVHLLLDTSIAGVVVEKNKLQAAQNPPGSPIFELSLLSLFSKA